MSQDWTLRVVIMTVVISSEMSDVTWPKESFMIFVINCDQNSSLLIIYIVCFNVCTFCRLSRKLVLTNFLVCIYTRNAYIFATTVIVVNLMVVNCWNYPKTASSPHMHYATFGLFLKKYNKNSFHQFLRYAINYLYQTHSNKSCKPSIYYSLIYTS